MAKATPIDPNRIKRDPVYFIERVIGMKLKPFQAQWVMDILKYHRLCYMAFRTSGKTRQLFVNFFLWAAVTRPNTQYLIISKTLPQAVEVLKDIRLTVLTNPILKTLVPSNRSQSWSRTELELENHSRILSKAYNDNVRGWHVNGVGCDEMGEYEDHEILKKAVLPTIRAKRGFFVGVGTPKSELDLLHEIERDPGFKSIHFDRFPAEGEKGDLFLERYPDTVIRKVAGAVEIRDKVTNNILETYNNMTWAQEFLLCPVSMKDKLFPDSMVRECLDDTATFEEGVKNMHQYFMGVDFAMSAQSGSDFTVITILEKAPSSKRFKIIWMERMRGMDYTMQKSRIKELAERYKIIKALGDENSFGKTFIYDLKVMGVPIDGYKFTYQSGSKEELVKALRDQFEKKGFLIPYSPNDVKTKGTVDTLIDELTKFGIVFDMRKKKVSFEGTGKHDDTVISLGLANFIARNITMGCFTALKGSEKKNPFLMK